MRELINTASLSITLSDSQIQQIEQHLYSVIEANKTTNLTRIDTLEQGALLHIEDSLAALPEISAAPNGLYADLGTGGGFPGIPIAIATGRQTLLVDSVKKKVAILAEIVSNLGLSNQITTYAGRIEDLDVERKGQFSVLTARALSSLTSLMELSSPLLMENGRLVCYKSHISEEELAHAKTLNKKLALYIISHRSFTLSDNETLRTIIVFEKRGNPTLHLPRKMSMAQKKPL